MKNAKFRAAYANKSEEEKRLHYAESNSKKAKIKFVDPVLYRRQADHANRLQRSIYALNLIAKSHNTLYTNKHDKIPEVHQERESTVHFGKPTTRAFYSAPRLNVMEKDGKIELDAMGHIEKGHFAQCPHSSMTRVMHNVNGVLWNDPRNRRMVTLDPGHGNGYPSQVFSQYLWDLGFHVGVEICPGLSSNSWANLRLVTLKGIHNVEQGYFDEKYVKEHGELSRVVPPRAFFVNGRIVSLNFSVSLQIRFIPNFHCFHFSNIPPGKYCSCGDGGCDVSF